MRSLISPVRHDHDVSDLTGLFVYYHTEQKQILQGWTLDVQIKVDSV